MEQIIYGNKFNKKLVKYSNVDYNEHKIKKYITLYFGERTLQSSI